MTPKYLLKDEKNVVGQSIAITQGENKTITVFLFNEDGSPLRFTTPTEIVVKIFSQINSASIQKKLSTSTVTPLQVANLGGDLIALQFSLLTADTTSMAANSSGLPMTIAITDADGLVSQLEVVSAFDVTVPVVVT